MQKRFLTYEAKGLLDGLEREVRNVRFNLAEDTMKRLDYDTSVFKKYIERIEVKFKEYIDIITEEEEDGDELY